MIVLRQIQLRLAAEARLDRASRRLAESWPFRTIGPCSTVALPRVDICGEQADEAAVHGLFQVLLATRVALGCQYEGVTKEELNLLQFTSTYMAKLCAGLPKI